MSDYVHDSAEDARHTGVPFRLTYRAHRGAYLGRTLYTRDDRVRTVP